MVDFGLKVREEVCEASALTSVLSRPDTESSRDVVLSDFGTEASEPAGGLS
jgi:hypothetical protein